MGYYHQQGVLSPTGVPPTRDITTNRGYYHQQGVSPTGGITTKRRYHQQRVSQTRGVTNKGYHQQGVSPTKGITDRRYHQQGVSPTGGTTNRGYHQQGVSPAGGTTNKGYHQQGVSPTKGRLHQQTGATNSSFPLAYNTYNGDKCHQSIKGPTVLCILFRMIVLLLFAITTFKRKQNGGRAFCFSAVQYYSGIIFL